MEPPTAALTQGFTEQSVRLAVFDVEIRRRTDQWSTGEQVDLQSVIDLFQSVTAARCGNDRTLLALHEADTAELTGEVVVARTAPTPPRIMFYDFSAGRRVERSLDDLADTAVAWRLRFWTEDFDPPERPSYLVEIDDTPDDGPPSTASEADVVGGRSGEPAAWIDAVRSALVSDRDDRRSAKRQGYERGMDEAAIREAGGATGLRCEGRRVDEYGQQVVTLSVPETDDEGDDATVDLSKTDLAPGDDVLVTASVEALPVEGELFAVRPRAVELGIYWDTAAGSDAETAITPDADHRFGVAPLVTARPYEAIEGALRSLERRDHTGATYAATGDVRFAEPADLPDTERLNRSQRRAVERALAAEDICCVHAPPWTGARRTIQAIVAGAVANDRTVGLFAPSVEDLDRVLAADTADDDTTTLTTGASVSYARVTGETESAVDPWQADVVGLPIDQADPTQELTFDVGIVDQAARIDVARAAIPFASADRLILVGDPRQLPPAASLVGEHADLPRSIYEHIEEAYGEEVVAELRCQYGMNQAIAMYSNARYYDGRLIHGQDNRTWTIDTMAPLHPVHADGVPERTPTGSLHCDPAVDVAVDEVEAITARGIDGDDIGVIAPTSAQIGKLRAALDERGLGDAGVTVDRPAAFACHAREAIVLSLLAATDEGHRWSHETLNVALTRARRRLVIVANWSRLAAESDDAGATPATDLCRFLEARGLRPETG